MAPPRLRPKGSDVAVHAASLLIGIIGFYTPSQNRRAKAIWNVVDDYDGIVTTSSWRGSWPPKPGVDFVFTEHGLDAAAESRFAIWGPTARTLSDPLFEPSDILELLDLGPRLERPPLWAIHGRDRVAMESLLRLSEARERLRVHERPWERRTELTMITIHGPDKVAHIVWSLFQQVMFGPFDKEALLADASRWDGPIERPRPWGWGPLAGPYLEADAWLGRMLSVHGYDYVVFASDHGMTRNPGPGLSGQHNSSSTEAHVGIFSLTGPGVRRGAWLGKASVLDVAPTLAYVLELPVADDLPGRVLAGAFTDGWLSRKPVDWLDRPELGGFAFPAPNSPAKASPHV